MSWHSKWAVGNAVRAGLANQWGPIKQARMHLGVASLRTLGKKIAPEKARWILRWFYLRQEALTVFRSGKYYEISILLSLQR